MGWGGVVRSLGQFGGCVILGGGGVYRYWVFGNGDKVQYVRLFGQVLCGEADKLKGGGD